MTRFSDPGVVERDIAVFRNFWHTTSGLYIWEYLTTLDFELDVIRGRRPYRWTIWIYSLTRLSTLITVILNLATPDTTPINCQVWAAFEIIFGYLSIISTFLLIAFRIIAIWNKNRFVMGTAIILWVTNVVVITLGIVRQRSIRIPALQDCVTIDTRENKANIIVAVVTDIVLLLLVLVGLLRLLHGSGGSFALGRLLWKQGVIWLLISIIAGVPPTVFVILDLNGSWNLMFQLPSMIVMSIAAARMYRNLVNFVYGSTDIFESLDITAGKSTKTKRSPSAPAGTPLRQIEVALDISCERHSTAQSIISMDGRLGDRGDGPHASSLGSDLESAVVNPDPR